MKMSFLLNIFNKKEKVEKSDLDIAFEEYFKVAKIEAVEAMLKEGYIPNKQLKKHLQDTAMASLYVNQFPYAEYSEKINTIYPNSYIKYEKILLKNTAIKVIQTMVEHKLLDESFVQFFITMDNKKVKGFVFDKAKYVPQQIQSCFEHVSNERFTRINNYLWQDLLYPNIQNFNIATRLEDYPKTSFHLLLNESVEYVGFVLYKLKNPNASMSEAIDFVNKKISDEQKNILNSDETKYLLNKRELRAFKNEVLYSLKNIMPEPSFSIMAINYYIDQVNDKKLTPQQIFDQIISNNEIKNQSLNILNSLIVIYPDELIIPANEKKISEIIFSSHSSILINNEINQRLTITENSNFELSNVNNQLNNKKRFLFSKPSENLIEEQVNIITLPVLEDILNKLKIVKLENSIYNVEFDDIINSPLLINFKENLEAFAKAYKSINIDSIDSEDKNFVNNMKNELINIISTYLELKNVELDTYQYPQISKSIDEITVSIEKFALEKASEQINTLLINKKTVSVKI